MSLRLVLPVTCHGYIPLFLSILPPLLSHNTYPPHLPPHPSFFLFLFSAAESESSLYRVTLLWDPAYLTLTEEEREKKITSPHLKNIADVPLDRVAEVLSFSGESFIGPCVR